MLIKSINIFCAKSDIKFYDIYGGELVDSYAFFRKDDKGEGMPKGKYIIKSV